MVVEVMEVLCSCADVKQDPDNADLIRVRVMAEKYVMMLALGAPSKQACLEKMAAKMSLLLEKKEAKEALRVQGLVGAPEHDGQGGNLGEKAEELSSDLSGLCLSVM